MQSTCIRRYSYLCLYSCLLLFSCEATALCINLGFANVPSTVTFSGGAGGYHVYDAEKYRQTVNFQVRGEATGATCEYFVALSSGQSGTFNQRHLVQAVNLLNYNVYTDATGNSILKAPPLATSSEVIAGSFPIAVALTQTNNHTFVWSIDPRQIVPSFGSPYADANLLLSLYSGLPLSNPTLVTSTAITFHAVVESSVDLSLVRSGAPFNLNETTQLIDFGILESGAQRGFDLVIRSNNGYAVTMQSLNHQRMIHTRAPTVKDSVAYSIVLNGGGLDLSSGAPIRVISATGTTPATGIAFPLEFTVDALSGTEAAGSYTDIISVEVIAN